MIGAAAAEDAGCPAGGTLLVRLGPATVSNAGHCLWQMQNCDIGKCLQGNLCDFAEQGSNSAACPAPILSNLTRACDKLCSESIRGAAHFLSEMENASHSGQYLVAKCILISLEAISKRVAPH